MDGKPEQYWTHQHDAKQMRIIAEGPIDIKRSYITSKTCSMNAQQEFDYFLI
jgi:hypothetical protein